MTATETQSETAVFHFPEKVIIRHAWRDRHEPATIHYLATLEGAWIRRSTTAGEPLHLDLADVLDAAEHPPPAMLRGRVASAA